MGNKANSDFGRNLRRARLRTGKTQTALAKASKVSRLHILRIEHGVSTPRLDEAIRLARVLKIPLQWFITGTLRPPSSLQGIASELYRLGIRDLDITGDQVPGAFRRREEVLAVALAGDHPEPRIVEAIPALLAWNKFDVSLTLAFADYYDARIRIRLAWLSDIARTLGQVTSFPRGVRWPGQLSQFIKSAKPGDRDSLGHPGTGKRSSLKAKWNIDYVSNMNAFLLRAKELQTAIKRSSRRPETDQ